MSQGTQHIIALIWAVARKERVLLVGTDQRITSGPAATTAALRGRIHGCTRIVSQKVQILFPCTAGAVHTWHIGWVPGCTVMSVAGGS
jgi:hypothetical protein